MTVHSLRVFMCLINLFENADCFAVLRWLREQDPNAPINPDVVIVAARFGNLDVLGYLIDDARVHYVPDTVMNTAASWGQLRVLKWLRARGVAWSPHLCTAAANHGHLHVLKWACDNGCPCDRKQVSYAAGYSAQALSYTYVDINLWLDKRFPC